MDFKNMTESELTAFLTFTKALADRASFGTPGSLTSFDDKDDAQRAEWIREAQDAAQAYADARRDGKRTRSYNQDTPLQREAVQQAKDWLARKRKSVVRK